MKEIVTVEDFFQASKKQAIQRLAYSKEDVAYKTIILKTMKQLGLEIKVDRIGNICGTLKGNGKSDKSILVGSHTDSVKDGGQFDGPVGVVAGLKAVEEVIRLRKEEKIQIPSDIKVVVWAAEESNRFGKACIGSKAVEGTLNKESLQKKEVLDKPEHKKETLQQAVDGFLRELHQVGVAFEMTDTILSEQEIYRAYEEHIEQYQSLKEQNLDIGIVTSIVAPYRMKITVDGKDKIVSAAKLIEKINQKAIEAEKEDKYRATVPMYNMAQPSKAKHYMDVVLMGESAHSGATPMTRRKDAVLEAAKIILTLNEQIQEQGYDFKVFFEQINTQNDSMNKVAGKTQMRLGIDTKGLDETIIGQVLKNLIQQIAGQRGVNTEVSKMFPKQIKEPIEEKNELNIDIRMQQPIKPETMFNEVSSMMTQIAHETKTNFFVTISDKAEPVKTNSDMGTQIEEVCQKNNIKAVYMPSWAGHDIAHVPSSEKILIFIPSTGGSHNPKEMTTLDAIQKGIIVLTQSIIEDEKQITKMVEKVNQIPINEELSLITLDMLIVAKKMGVKIPSQIMQEMRKVWKCKKEKMEQAKDKEAIGK